MNGLDILVLARACFFALPVFFSYFVFNRSLTDFKSCALCLALSLSYFEFNVIIIIIVSFFGALNNCHHITRWVRTMYVCLCCAINRLAYICLLSFFFIFFFLLIAFFELLGVVCHRCLSVCLWLRGYAWGCVWRVCVCESWSCVSSFFVFPFRFFLN